MFIICFCVVRMSNLCKRHYKDVYLPIPPNPLVDIDNKEYFEEVIRYNEKLYILSQQYIGNIYRYITYLIPVCFYTVGSDGRKEKGTDSKLEIKVVYRGENHHYLFIKGMLSEFINIKNHREIYDITEYKNLKDDTSIFLAYDNHRLFFPSRVYDSLLVMGDEELEREVLDKALQEIRIYYKKINKYIRTRINNSKKIILTGKNKVRGKEIAHFDIDKGLLFYSGQDNYNIYSLSTKIGHLRFVQYLVEKIYTKSIKEGWMDIKDVVYHEPKQIIYRLQSLKDNKLLKMTQQDVDDLQDTYLYFLRLYHISQYQFKMRGQKQTHIPCVKEFKERSFFLIRVFSRENTVL